MVSVFPSNFFTLVYMIERSSTAARCLSISQSNSLRISVSVPLAIGLPSTTNITASVVVSGCSTDLVSSSIRGLAPMKQQHIAKSTPPSRPVIIDEQRPPSNVPVVTVVYVEVGGMDATQYRELAGQFATQYQGSVRGNFYLIPVRDGKIPTDIQFATEFLDVVNKVCEVRADKIVLRTTASDVRVKRLYVDERSESYGD